MAVVVDALGRKWDSKLHPRDRDGRFLRTFRKVRLFDVGGTKAWGTGTVDSITDEGHINITVGKIRDDGSAKGKIGQKVTLPASSLESMNEHADLASARTSVGGDKTPNANVTEGDKGNQEHGVVKANTQQEGKKGAGPVAFGLSLGFAPEDTNQAAHILSDRTNGVDAPRGAYLVGLWAHNQRQNGKMSDQDFVEILDDLGVEGGLTDESPDGLTGLQHLVDRYNETVPSEWPDVVPTVSRRERQHSSGARVGQGARLIENDDGKKFVALDKFILTKNGDTYDKFKFVPDMHKSIFDAALENQNGVAPEKVADLDTPEVDAPEPAQVSDVVPADAPEHKPAEVPDVAPAKVDEPVNPDFPTPDQIANGLGGRFDDGQRPNRAVANIGDGKKAEFEQTDDEDIYDVTVTDDNGDELYSGEHDVSQPNGALAADLYESATGESYNGLDPVVEPDEEIDIPDAPEVDEVVPDDIISENIVPNETPEEAPKPEPKPEPKVKKSIEIEPDAPKADAPDTAYDSVARNDANNPDPEFDWEGADQSQVKAIDLQPGDHIEYEAYVGNRRKPTRGVVGRVEPDTRDDKVIGHRVFLDDGGTKTYLPGNKTVTRFDTPETNEALPTTDTPDDNVSVDSPDLTPHFTDLQRAELNDAAEDWQSEGNSDTLKEAARKFREQEPLNIDDLRVLEDLAGSDGDRFNQPENSDEDRQAGKRLQAAASRFRDAIEEYNSIGGPDGREGDRNRAEDSSDTRGSSEVPDSDGVAGDPDASGEGVQGEPSDSGTGGESEGPEPYLVDDSGTIIIDGVAGPDFEDRIDASVRDGGNRAETFGEIESSILAKKKFVAVGKVTKGSKTTYFHAYDPDGKGSIFNAERVSEYENEDAARTRVQSFIDGDKNLNPTFASNDPNDTSGVDPSEGTVAERRSRLTAGIDSGIKTRGEFLAAEGVNGQVEKITFNDGTIGIKKAVYRGDGTFETNELFESLAEKIGAKTSVSAPFVDQDDDDKEYILSDFINGEHLEESKVFRETKEFQDAAYTREGAALGIADWLSGNEDRHSGNWLLGPDGEPTAIDNDLAGFVGGRPSGDFLSAAVDQDYFTPEDIDRIVSEMIPEIEAAQNDKYWNNGFDPVNDMKVRAETLKEFINRRNGKAPSKKISNVSDYRRLLPLISGSELKDAVIEYQGFQFLLDAVEGEIERRENAKKGIAEGEPADEDGLLSTQTPVQLDAKAAKHQYKEYRLNHEMNGIIQDLRHYTMPEGLTIQQRYHDNRSENEVIDSAKEILKDPGHKYHDQVYKGFANYQEYDIKRQENLTTQALYETEYDRRPWPRAFLVNNITGHVHKDKNCSTCYPNTQYKWMTEYSDHSEEEIIDAAGNRACTTCYPNAPVESLGKPSKMFSDEDIRRAEAKKIREAKKEEKVRKAIEKGLTKNGDPLLIPNSSGRTRRDGTVFTDEIKTEQAGWNELSRELYYPLNNPEHSSLDENGVVNDEFVAARIAELIKAIAWKNNTSVQDIADQAIEKVRASMKRNKEENWNQSFPGKPITVRSGGVEFTLPKNPGERLATPEIPDEFSGKPIPFDRMVKNNHGVDELPNGGMLDLGNGWTYERDGTGGNVSHVDTPEAGDRIEDTDVSPDNLDEIKNRANGLIQTRAKANEERADAVATGEAPEPVDPVVEDTFEDVPPSDIGGSGGGSDVPEAPGGNDESDEEPEQTPEPVEPIGSGFLQPEDFPFERTEPVQLPDESYPPSRQQQDVNDAVAGGHNVGVAAKAGTGKTSTLVGVAKRNSDKKILYLAYNRSVMEEGQKRMPDNVTVLTGHAAAYRAAPQWMKDKSFGKGKYNPDKMLTKPQEQSRHLNIPNIYDQNEKQLHSNRVMKDVLKSVSSFSKSGADQPGPEHLRGSLKHVYGKDRIASLEAVSKAWDDLTSKDGKIRFNGMQDVYRKMWALDSPDLGENYDMVFLDEAQDTPPVLGDLLNKQTIQKVIVGDSDQSIYASFAETEDYLENSDTEFTLPLNKSYRFGPDFADIANRFLQGAGSRERVIGGGNPNSHVLGEDEEMENPDAILTRTNGGMLGHIIDEFGKGRKVAVPPKTKDDLLKLVDTVGWLRGENAKPWRIHEELEQYSSWDEIQTEAEKGDDPKIKMIARVYGQDPAWQIRKYIEQLTEGEDLLEDVLEPKEVFNDKGDFIGLSVNEKVQGNAVFGTFKQKDRFKKQGFKWNKDDKQWTFFSNDADKARAAWERAVEDIKANTTTGKPDVMISTAHKAKGLEWKRVKIGDDFNGPEIDPNTGDLVDLDAEEYRLGYVAVTRAEEELDLGSLSWIYNNSEENGGNPEIIKEPAPHDDLHGRVDEVKEALENKQHYEGERELPEPVAVPDSPDDIDIEALQVESEDDTGENSSSNDEPASVADIEFEDLESDSNPETAVDERPVDNPPDIPLPPEAMPEGVGERTPEDRIGDLLDKNRFGTLRPTVIRQPLDDGYSYTLIEHEYAPDFQTATVYDPAGNPIGEHDYFVGDEEGVHFYGVAEDFLDDIDDHKNRDETPNESTEPTQTPTEESVVPEDRTDTPESIVEPENIESISRTKKEIIDGLSPEQYDEYEDLERGERADYIDSVNSGDDHGTAINKANGTYVEPTQSFEDRYPDITGDETPEQISTKADELQEQFQGMDPSDPDYGKVAGKAIEYLNESRNKPVGAQETNNTATEPTPTLPDPKPKTKAQEKNEQMGRNLRDYFAGKDVILTADEEEWRVQLEMTLENDEGLAPDDLIGGENPVITNYLKWMEEDGESFRWWERGSEISTKMRKGDMAWQQIEDSDKGRAHRRGEGPPDIRYGRIVDMPTHSQPNITILSLDEDGNLIPNEIERGGYKKYRFHMNRVTKFHGFGEDGYPLNPSGGTYGPDGNPNTPTVPTPEDTPLPPDPALIPIPPEGTRPSSEEIGNVV